MLTRALGHARMADGRPLVPDVLERAVVLEPNDTLILSSDGLHDLVDDWETVGLSQVRIAMKRRRRSLHSRVTEAVMTILP